MMVWAKASGILRSGVFCMWAYRMLDLFTSDLIVSFG